ncbi:MAG: glycogen debranching N-terminal domain-containing protein, partial [Terriglobales bacterium]
MGNYLRVAVLYMVAALCLIVGAGNASVLAAQESASEQVKPAAPDQSGSGSDGGKKTTAAKPDEYAIQAAVPDSPRLVLKYGKQFMLMDDLGMAGARNPYGFGLYEDDTRYLSQWQMNISGTQPVLLSSDTEPGYHGRFLYS